MEPIAIDIMLTVLNILLASPENNIQLNSKDIKISSLLRFGGDDHMPQTCEIQETFNSTIDYQMEAKKRLKNMINDIKAIKTHLSITNSCSNRQDGVLVKCVNNQYGDDWLLIAHRNRVTNLFSGALETDLSDNGVGNFEDEFFIGFKKLRTITDSQMCELLIVEIDGSNKKWYDHYQTVAFGHNNKVKLLGKHSTNRKDAFIGLLAHAEEVNKKLKLYLNPNTDVTIYLRKTSLDEAPTFKTA